MRTLDRIDRALRRALTALCCVLLALMVAFTTYSVVMRTAFLVPPFWGDTLTLFANIWLVMLAFAIAVREDANIAVESLYTFLSPAAVKAVKAFWLALFAVIGLVMMIYGWQAARRILGAYWELGNLPKSYPMAILPISGALIFLSALLAIGDTLKGRRSTNEEDR